MFYHLHMVILPEDYECVPWLLILPMLDPHSHHVGQSSLINQKVNWHRMLDTFLSVLPMGVQHDDNHCPTYLSA